MFTLLQGLGGRRAHPLRKGISVRNRGFSTCLDWDEDDDVVDFNDVRMLQSGMKH